VFTLHTLEIISHDDEEDCENETNEANSEEVQQNSTTETDTSTTSMPLGKSLQSDFEAVRYHKL
jgi:hypothetical protein